MKSCNRSTEGNTRDWEFFGGEQAWRELFSTPHGADKPRGWLGDSMAARKCFVGGCARKIGAIDWSCTWSIFRKGIPRWFRKVYFFPARRCALYLIRARRCVFLLKSGMTTTAGCVSLLQTSNGRNPRVQTGHGSRLCHWIWPTAWHRQCGLHGKNKEGAFFIFDFWKCITCFCQLVKFIAFSRFCLYFR